jgi:TatD DNase family protein
MDRYELFDQGALAPALAEIAEHQILTISVSMDLPSFRRNQEISQMCDLVVPIFGVHPWNAPEYAGRLDELSQVIEESSMIGEIGLDHFFVEDPSAYPAQRQVFEFFLGAVKGQDKIVNLHTKGAEIEVLGLLDQYDIDRMIVHWYSGPLETLREFVARGASFTVGVEVLYSEHIRTIARAIPEGQLLTETDNPGAPRGFLGRLGSPMLVEDVVRGVAEARGTTAESVVETVRANMLALVGDDPRLSKMHTILDARQEGD